MAQLISAAISSLDGFIADEDGSFDWAVPDDEVHASINDLERPIGTYLYGRRMYEVMVAWESPDVAVGQPPVAQDYAEIWRAAEKIVYSRTLDDVSSARTRIERAFDPATIGEMKSRAERDLSISGPGLAAHAFRAGLIDACHLFVAPVVVGGGTRFFPHDLRLVLELLNHHRFHRGFVHLHYRVR